MKQGSDDRAANLGVARCREELAGEADEEVAVPLAVLGLVVEFHLLEPAWPGHLRSLNRLILLDTGLYGFLVIRQLTNMGFHFVPRWQDVKTGLRELFFYAPIALVVGLGL